MWWDRLDGESRAGWRRVEIFSSSLSSLPSLCLPEAIRAASLYLHGYLSWHSPHCARSLPRSPLWSLWQRLSSHSGQDNKLNVEILTRISILFPPTSAALLLVSNQYLEHTLLYLIQSPLYRCLHASCISRDRASGVGHKYTRRCAHKLVLSLYLLTRLICIFIPSLLLHSRVRNACLFLLKTAMPALQSYDILLDLTNDMHDPVSIQPLRDYGRQTSRVVLLLPTESLTLILESGSSYQYAVKFRTKVANVTWVSPYSVAKSFHDNSPMPAQDRGET